MPDLERDVLSLIRLALVGKPSDVAALGRRMTKVVAERRPDLADEAAALSAISRTRSTRKVATTASPVPLDQDSRLDLVRREDYPTPAATPVWTADTKASLTAIVAEHEVLDRLAAKGLVPTRSALLVGPPGVGKTLSAKWLAAELGRALLTLDLSAVMSSYLGRTGNNLRMVLDYASREPAVLLLDEFDAIAKRRDDPADIGELKRLVTVLLQAIDDWPAGGLLLAATNHPELLDRAVWRRFEQVVDFPLPSAVELRDLAKMLLLRDGIDPAFADVLAALFDGRSQADLTREYNHLRKRAILSGHTAISGLDIEAAIRDMPRRPRIGIAVALVRAGWSARRASELTGVSRDTIRAHVTQHGGDDA